MKLIPASYKILTKIDGAAMLRHIEVVARNCYKSEERIEEGSADKLIGNLLSNDPPHEAMIEHAPNVSVKFIVDRGVSHELVRHRHASFAQESTRYCNYGKERFGKEITFVRPSWYVDLPKHNDLAAQKTFCYAIREAERSYFSLLDAGWSPQQARSVLPNALKTEIVVTTNVRHWRLIFSLRCYKNAHPQMREVMVPLLAEFKQLMPVLFDDIPEGEL